MRKVKFTIKGQSIIILTNATDKIINESIKLFKQDILKEEQSITTLIPFLKYFLIKFVFIPIPDKVDKEYTL